MINVYEGIPWDDTDIGKRKLVDTMALLVMQIALLPGQTVPRHNANSHVHLLVLRGSPTVILEGREIETKEGCLLPVPFGTPMEISNRGQTDTTFLVWKTPHPDQIKK